MIWDKPTSHRAFSAICQLAGGTLPAVTSKEELDRLVQQFKFNVRSDEMVDPNNLPEKVNFYLRNRWDEERQLWADPMDSSRAYTDTLRTPYSEESLYGMVYVNDFAPVTSFDESGRGFCDLTPSRNKFFIDGLCPSSEADYFDTTYYIQGLKNSLPLFRYRLNLDLTLIQFHKLCFSTLIRGWRRSQIFYDPGLETWVLTSLADPTRRMVMLNEDEGIPHPFGTRDGCSSTRKYIQKAIAEQ